MPDTPILTPRQRELLKRYTDEYLTRKPDEAVEEVPPALEQIVVPSGNHMGPIVLGRNAQDFPYDSDGLATALKNVHDWAKAHNGYVVSGPQLVYARIHAGFDDHTWTNYYDVQTEIDAGKTSQGTDIAIVVHGPGLITPDKAKWGLTKRNDAYPNLIDGAVKYTDKELSDISRGRLPDGSTIPIFCYADFLKENNLPYHFGIAIDASKVPESGQQASAGLMHNPLYIAFCGSMQLAEQYQKRVIEKGWTQYGVWHTLDQTQSHGRVLFVGNSSDGLGGGNYLSDLGRFVGVEAPEAHAAPKK